MIPHVSRKWHTSERLTVREYGESSMWSDLKFFFSEELEIGIDLARVIFMQFFALYVIAAIGQLISWDCYLPSCKMAAEATRGKFIGLASIMFIELLLIVGLALVIPICVSFVKILFYCFAFAAFIVLVVVGIGFVIGALVLVYFSFRDFGFWGGVASIFAIMMLLGLFGGRARRYASTQWDSYYDRSDRDELAQAAERRREEQAYADKRRAEEMAGRLDSPWQDNPNLHGDNPYSNK